METPTADDLLQFRDYSGGAPAQINVNSPTHSSGGGSGGSAGGGGSNNANAQRQRGDPLADLIYDMTSSAQGQSGDGGQQGQNSSLDGSAGGAGGGSGGARLSFLTIEYYQQFFNVDTYMVLERIANSMIPKRAAGNYLRMNIGENPDLYGPFWITVTLVSSQELVLGFLKDLLGLYN